MRTLAIVLFVAACGGSSAKPSGPTPSNTAEPAPATATPTRDAELETAQRYAAEALKDAAEAMERVEALSRDLDAFAVKLDAAINDVTSAQNDADRKAATEKLRALQNERAEMKARIAAAKAAAARAERRKGSVVSKECMNNPLAKGCE